MITPTISIVSGNNQTTVPNVVTPQPLVIQVLNGSTPIANAPVTFYVVPGYDCSLALTSTGAHSTLFHVVTDATGHAQVYCAQGVYSSDPSMIRAQVLSASVEFTETTDSTPATPIGLQVAKGTNPGELNLSWINVGNGATYLKIHQSTDGVTWMPTVTLSDPTTTTYTVTGLDDSQSYYFGVCAGN